MTVYDASPGLPPAGPVRGFSAESMMRMEFDV